MNAKGNPQKRSNKELSAAMIPKIMSGMTSTKSTDNVLLNPVSILVKSEEELGISSMKAVQSNTYKNKDTSNSSIQSTINQIGSDASILYKSNISNAESCDQKPALELCQSNTDSHTISNSDNVSNSNKEIVSCSDAYPQSQNTTINEQKPINSIAIQPIQPRRRGRPRKYVYIQTPEECNNYYPQSHVSNSETSTYCTKNSMDTSVISTNSKSPDSNVKIDTVESDYKPKRRGRLPSKNKGILKNDIKNHDKKEISVDTLNNTHISQLSKLSITCNENSRLTIEEQDMTQPVKCMRCGKEVIKNEWLAHNLTKHNNMGWYEGEEPMDFQNDTKLLKRVLSNAIKKKKGQLCCEQCGAVKRSVNGFVSHIQFCGKSDDERRALMVTCPVCNAVMMPSSMEIHERHHRELKYSKRKNFVTEPIENEKVKRKAAERAVSKILQFTESVKEEYIGQPKKVELNSSVLAAETAPNTSTKCEDTLDDINETSNVTGIVCQENKSFETEPHPLKVKKPKNEGDSFTKIENTLPATEDQYDTFGSYVASEIRCLNSDYLRRKLKRKIQCAIIDIQDEEDRLPGSTTPESSFT